MIIMGEYSGMEPVGMILLLIYTIYSISDLISKRGDGHTILGLQDHLPQQAEERRGQSLNRQIS